MIVAIPKPLELMSCLRKMLTKFFIEYFIFIFINILKFLLFYFYRFIYVVTSLTYQYQVIVTTFELNIFVNAFNVASLLHNIKHNTYD